jgi:hypothetical protein
MELKKLSTDDIEFDDNNFSIDDNIENLSVNYKANEMVEITSMALKSGYSIEEICHKFKFDRGEVVSVCDDMVEQAKQNAPKQRILFRQSVRDKMVCAKQYLVEVLNGDHDLEPQKLTSMKLAAAKQLLTFGQRYVIEDPMTWYSEQTEDTEDREGIPHFEIEVDSQGKTNHVVRYIDVE